MYKNKPCQTLEIESISKVDYYWQIINKIGIRRKRALSRFHKGQNNEIDSSKIPRILNLKPEEIVEVRSEKEILATLDRAKYMGLSFMPEMLKFCGKKFNVLKRVEKYIVEGKVPKRVHMKNTAILDGVYCDGSWHGGCDRTCFCLWREKWLKRV